MLQAAANADHEAATNPEYVDWSPYGRYWNQEATANDSNSQFHKKRLSRSHQHTSLTNDMRVRSFDALFETIARMPFLPTFSSFYLDPAAAQKAEDFLGMLRENYEVTPPKIIPEEGDTLVFTWDIGEFRRYLSVAEDWYDLIDIHHTLDVRCKHDIPQDSQAAVAALLGELKFVAKSSSTR